jgi:hypothetical protein
MGKTQAIEFNASGVTIGDRQIILRDIYRKLVKLANKVPPPSQDRPLEDPNDPEEVANVAFGGWLRTIDVKLESETSNKVDKYAIKVMVYSRIKERWVHLGYVPQKYKVDVKKEGRRGGIPLNEILHPLVSKGYISSTSIVGLGHWTPFEEDGEPKVIYYLKVKVEYTLP